ncbi:MAG: NAD-dependent epimerase/dehydratase family protein [Rhizobiaceae bacterium]|nr:NAD-dependent epimerase/dehydratase family protein [Rhizobiaceae bacterium]
MKVAVTGASGFVGRQVVAHLDQAGLPVVLLRHGTSTDRPIRESRRLPRPDEPDDEFATALAGVSAIVHCAGLTNAAADTPEAAYFQANAQLTERLALAAERSGSKRFILLSSIRAVAAAGFDGTITPDMTPAPDDSYGRSKLAGEQAAERAFAAQPGQLTVLRLPPVYGAGMKGNLQRLMRLADTPFPLPLGGVEARRSLVGAQSVGEIAAALLTRPPTRRTIYLIGDREPATLWQILGAFRDGLGRPRRLPAIPGQVFAALAGASSGIRALSVNQICDVGALTEDGLPVRTESTAGLRKAAEAWVSAGRPKS